MNRSKFKRTDVIIIVIIFALYMIGYAWMIEPKKKSSKKDDVVVVHQAMTPRPSATPKKLKSLPPEWPVDSDDRGRKHEFDEASYFQDHYDEYLDDPEDVIRFPPEIFDANED